MICVCLCLTHDCAMKAHVYRVSVTTRQEYKMHARALSNGAYQTRLSVVLMALSHGLMLKCSTARS